MDLPTQNKLKLSRTSTHKVRSGCITCKKRHIKCDEAQPHCNNCLKSRGTCEGYAPIRKKRASSPVQFRWDSKRLARSTSPPMQLKLDPDSLDFQDAKGMLYFQEFVGLAQGRWVNAVGCNTLWELLPQLAFSDGTIRSAAIAVGALSLWHRQSTHDSLRTISVPTIPKAERDAHYFYAVAYYCRSLKLQNQHASARDAMFLSVLWLVFETLRGGKRAALSHVNHGLAILLELLTGEDVDHRVAELAPSPAPLLEAVANIFVPLAMQARAVLQGRIGNGPPLPSLTKGLRSKKKTMESFIILMSHLTRPKATMENIPAVFNNLDEFEEYWVTAQRAQIVMASIMTDVMRDSGVFASNGHDIIKKFYSALLGDGRILEISQNSGKVMQKLDAAFLPLFNKILMSDVESPEYLKAIHLRLEYLGVYIFNDPPQFLDIETLHSRTPLFREYLSLAEVALRIAKREIKNPAHQFSLQCGLAFNLLITSFFCRDPLTRDQAVWMLREYPAQDGLWNTRSLYLLALRNRDVEKSNTVEGTPMEQLQRLWRREFVFEDGGDRILFRYYDKDKVTGEWELIEEVVEVREDAEDIHWKRQPLTGSGGLLMKDLYVE
ncbi:uncharacterized protein F4822DRAFT_437552 [Hypoxylon trugodes]|uniref:uncharacterized protein n=1 Tax=Hypoxylon trugodes TaxID=326681 RepID=UPI00219989E5|nr:uncharacterized protein F4822DRAFT_437552 [Hypoxylon trugodes]KAI1389239.1 hypothetical protein F4822DRAFT_437552 [Hypoxylon trugodes]